MENSNFSQDEKNKADDGRPALSVIVPVYNVEKYLRRCVDSILSQTLRHFNIILVDDGSTDSSGALCDEYAAMHDDIQVIHKPNGGLTSAWKTGMGAVETAYVGFVDSDDWIDADMYERLLDAAVKEEADIAVCGLVYDFEDPRIPQRYEGSNLDKDVYTRRDIENLFPYILNDGKFFGRTWQPARVTKIFRAELIRGNMKYCDEEVAVGEDLQITFPSLLDAEKLCVVRDFYPYHYWINSGSITGMYDETYIEKVKLLEAKLSFISEDKKVYDFAPQIRNDLASMAVLAVKNEIYRNYRSGRRNVVSNVRTICTDRDVADALANHTMTELSFSIKLYISLLKKGWYNTCYYLVLVFFRIQYFLGREYKRQ